MSVNARYADAMPAEGCPLRSGIKAGAWNLFM
jgi:hypothetical protein